MRSFTPASNVIRIGLLAAVGTVLASACFGQTGAAPPPAPHMVAAPGTGIVVTLNTGEVVRGRLVERTADFLKINSPLFGELTVPSSRIVSSAYEPAPASDGTAAPLPPPPPPPPPAPPPIPSEDELGFIDGWKGSVEGGLNGSDGNSEAFNLRFGAGAKRITDAMETSADASYKYATDDGDKSQSRGEANVRNDWNFGKDSPWGWFIKGTLEYDEFQDWNWRLSGYTGPFYRLIHNDTTTLKLRGGVGGAKEFGGSMNEIIPEALVGLDFDHKIADNQKIFVTTEWLPSLSDFPDYRWNAKAGYEILIDPKAKLTLKLGVEDRYDSNPGDGRDKNDIDYFALIAWAF